MLCHYKKNVLGCLTVIYKLRVAARVSYMRTRIFQSLLDVGVYGYIQSFMTPIVVALAF